MAASSSARRTSGPVLRSLSPSGRFASASASFMSQQCPCYVSSPSSPVMFDRPSSPTRVNLMGSGPGPSMKFSVTNSRAAVPSSAARKTCLCAPATHPGAFRCKLHRKAQSSNPSSGRSNSVLSNRLNARRSAMTNSLVRIGSVEGGEWVKRALAALIRPSSHQQKRRMDFQPRPSRLSAMSV
ncbi:hypothetical protein LUZ60_000900 [Juncus effusus]|nr:hypothetical protein LUZ60_000900 [Juncus effusus]